MINDKYNKYSEYYHRLEQSIRIWEKETSNKQLQQYVEEYKKGNHTHIIDMFKKIESLSVTAIYKVCPQFNESLFWDMLSVCHAKSYIALTKYNPDKGYFIPFFLRIARWGSLTYLAKYYKKLEREILTPFTSDVDCDDDQNNEGDNIVNNNALNEELAEDPNIYNKIHMIELHQFVAGLDISTEEYTIVLLRLHGYTFEEIAKRLCIKKKRVDNLLMHVRRVINNLEGEEYENCLEFLNR